MSGYLSAWEAALATKIEDLSGPAIPDGWSGAATSTGTGEIIPVPQSPTWLPITDEQRDGREVLAMRKDWERPMWCKVTARGWVDVGDGSPLAAWECPEPTHYFPLPEFKG